MNKRLTAMIEQLQALDERRNRAEKALTLATRESQRADEAYRALGAKICAEIPANIVVKISDTEGLLKYNETSLFPHLVKFL